MDSAPRRHRQLRRPLRRRASRTAVPDAGLAPRHRARRRQVRRHAGRDRRDRMRARAARAVPCACRSRSRSSASATRRACASARRCSAAARWRARSISALLDKADADGTTMRDALREFGLDPARIAERRAQARRRARLRRIAHRAGPGARSRRACRWAWSPRSTAATASASSSTGMAGHAGTVPMGLRRDALAAAAECVLAIERIAASMPRGRRHRGPHRGAAGRDERHSRARSRFSLDVRAPTDEQRARGRRGDARRMRGHRRDAATSR